MEHQAIKIIDERIAALESQYSAFKAITDYKVTGVLPNGVSEWVMIRLLMIVEEFH